MSPNSTSELPDARGENDLAAGRPTKESLLVFLGESLFVEDLKRQPLVEPRKYVCRLKTL